MKRKILTLVLAAILFLLSLGLTLASILLNFLSIQASKDWGLVLNWILILVSTPMVCSQIWVLGLFGWACLLMVCLKYLRKNKGPLV